MAVFITCQKRFLVLLNLCRFVDFYVVMNIFGKHFVNNNKKIAELILLFYNIFLKFQDFTSHFGS